MRYFSYLTHSLRKFVLSTLLVGLFCSLVQAAPPGSAAVLDFDGDGKTDYVVVRSEIPAGNSFKLVWYIRGSQRGDYAVQWGLDGWYLVPADYDGDGKWDIAVWAQSSPQAYFYILRSSDNSFQWIAWGRGDLFDDPLQTQDFDGDGKADPTVTRYQTINGSTRLYWYSLLSQNNELRAIQFGYGADRPLRGDFDGDGKADLALYRTQFGTPASTFIVQRSSDNQIQFYPFGNAETDHVLPADFDGDGITDFTLVRVGEQSTNWWHWRESSTGIVRSRQFGHGVPNIYADSVVPGDYDGDGKTDLAIWRKPIFSASQGFFYVERSRDGMYFLHWGFGRNENVPASVLQFR